MKQPILSYEPDIFSHNIAISKDMKRAHFHNTYEIYYLLSGKRRYFIQNQYFELNPGDLILIPPRVVHKVLNSKYEPPNSYHERYLLTFTEQLIDKDLLPCFSNLYYHFEDAKEKEYIKNLLEKISVETQTRDKYSMKMYKSYLTELLIILSRHHNEISKSLKNTIVNSHIVSIIDEITEYIRKNQRKQNLTLEQVSDHFGYSKEYISKKFKAINGIGYSEFLITSRLADCCDLLISTSLSINEIAVTCGFKDANYLISIFRKRIGITPHQYRKSPPSE